MAQPIINDILPYTQSIATSSQTVFSTNWTANYYTDVVVFYTPMGDAPDDAMQLLSNTLYSVAFIGDGNIVQVTLNSGANTGDIITITRMTPAQRLNLYSNTNFTPSMLNQDFGILTLVDQQAQLVNQQIAPRYNYSATIDPVVDTILPILLANQGWVKNSNDTAIIGYTFPASGIAPADDTYVLLTPDSALPNSLALSSLSTGFLVNQLAGNTLLTTTITGTSAQVTVTNGNGVGTTNVAIASNPILPGSAGMGIPIGTTAQRIIPGSNIALRYNTTLAALEYWNGSSWSQLYDDTYINPGLINELAWYAATGDTISGLPTVAAGVLTTVASVPTWATELSLALGGTNNDLTASAGGIVWSDSSKLNILAGTSTAGLPLLSGDAVAPAWGSYALALGGALTTGGAVTFSGAHAFIGILTADTDVTFPTSGTLATTAGLLTTINADSGSATLTSNAFTISGGSTGLTTVGSSATIDLIGTLGIGYGGTNVTSVTISPTATAFAGWDANKNMSANNFLPAYATTATAASTTTLTVASAYAQFFTGTTTQTLKLPVTSTLYDGFPYYIVNNSTGNVTIESSGGNTIQVMAAGTVAFLTCINTGVTTAAGWNCEYFFNGGEGSGTVNSGTQYDLAYYATTGTAVSGLTTVASAVLTTVSSVPTWATELSLALGGTNANLTASNGGILYSTASAAAILAGTGTAGLALLSGASTTPTWSNLPPITQINIQRVTATGAGTYTPTAGMQYVIVQAQAAGSGGGGAATASATQFALAAAGAGGEYMEVLFTAAQIGSSKSFSVGAGGAGGLAGANNGAVGGNTTFNTSWIVALGGAAGAAGSTAAASQIFQVGTAGGSGGSFSTGLLIKDIPGGNATPAYAFINQAIMSGAGISASCLFAPGPAVLISTAVAGGNANTNSGDGGGAAGTYNGGTQQAGGNGGAGFINFIEYISV